MKALVWIWRVVAALLVLVLAAAGAGPTALFVLVAWAAIEIVARRSRADRLPVAGGARDLTESSMRAGDMKRSLRTLEAVRQRALQRRDLDELEEVVRLTQTILERSGGKDDSWFGFPGEELGLADVDDGDVDRLGGGNASDGAWSSDGRWVVFSCGPGICVTRSDWRHDWLLIARTPDSFPDPDWQPLS